VTIRFTENTPINDTISVDLVPSIDIELTDVMSQIPKTLLTLTQDYGKPLDFWKKIECVPKEPQSGLTNYWKRSYTAQEKEIVKEWLPLQARHVIKIMKLIRDRKRLTMLKSYFFQCIVLFIYMEKMVPQTASELLALAVEFLVSAVQKKQLPDFFFPSINLLADLQDIHVTDIVTKFKSIQEALQGKGSLQQALPLVNQ